MSDPWVANVQVWLNNTYTGVPGWELVTVDGQTSWPTMYALTRALQHELGITSLSDNFGPGTLSALAAIGNIGPSTSNKNIIRIVQGGMYCKGYNGGDGLLDGDYSSTTTAGVQSLRQDIGLSFSTGTLSPKLFKALLTMDAYVLIVGGTLAIRTIQRNLNGRYLHREDFFVIPTDGYFSRDVQRALMFAIQYEIGMADGVANGNFGPGTQQGLRDQANVGAGSSDATTGKYFIHLFQAALIFNARTTTYNGSFTSATATVAQAFQNFCLLPETGRSDFQTWASLLVSTGDITRPGTAVDCITTITPARAQTLFENGYQTVGRYLTNSPVADPLDKNIKPGELTTIFANTLTVFPIFQEGSASLDAFGYSQGAYAGYKAHAAARQYGFKPNTVIYYAVDFDAVQDEVYSNVVPHFEGIRDALAAAGSPYRVGIYGARNTCSIVSNQGLAELSFVSGMSTGYSGNLGFPLPSNWAFDQILEYSIGSGAGAIGIDKDVKSGRDNGQSTVLPVALNSEFFTFLDAVQALAEIWSSAHSGSDTPNNLVLQYLREPDYNDWYWPLAAGNVDRDFVVHVNNQLTRLTAFFDPGTLGKVGISHLAAAANGVTYNGLPLGSNSEVNLADLTGWAGDLISTMAEYAHNMSEYDAYAFGVEFIGGPDSELFDTEDYIQDVDGMNLALRLAATPTLTFAAEFRNYYGSGGGWDSRYGEFKTRRFGNSSSAVNDAAESAYFQQSNEFFNIYRVAILAKNGVISDVVPVQDRTALCAAFRDVLNMRIATQ